MKIVKYKRPISDCVLCYVRIIAYTAILAVIFPIIYFVLTHAGTYTVDVVSVRQADTYLIFSLADIAG